MEAGFRHAKTISSALAVSGLWLSLLFSSVCFRGWNLRGRWRWMTGSWPLSGCVVFPSLDNYEADQILALPDCILRPRGHEWVKIRSLGWRTSTYFCVAAVYGFGKNIWDVDTENLIKALRVCSRLVEVWTAILNFFRSFSSTKYSTLPSLVSARSQFSCSTCGFFRPTISRRSAMWY